MKKNNKIKHLIISKDSLIALLWAISSINPPLIVPTLILTYISKFQDRTYEQISINELHELIQDVIAQLELNEEENNRIEKVINEFQEEAKNFITVDFYFRYYNDFIKTFEFIEKNRKDINLNMEQISQMKKILTKLQLFSEKEEIDYREYLQNLRFYIESKSWWRDYIDRYISFNVKLSMKSTTKNTLPTPDFVEGLLVEERVQFLEEFLEKSKAIILGQGLIGKTTLLEYVTQKYASQKEPKKIPVLVYLNNYNSPNYIQNHIKRCLGFDEATLQRELDSGRFLILLDAFNELKKEHFTNGRDEIQFFLRYKSNNKIILTCRTSEYRDEFPELEKGKLKPLDPEEQQELVGKIIGDDEKTWKFFKDMKERGPYLQELLGLPFFTKHIVEMYIQSNELVFPVTSTDVFDFIMWKWFDHEAKKWDNIRGMPKKHFSYALNLLAFQMHKGFSDEKGEQTTIRKNSVIELYLKDKRIKKHSDFKGETLLNVLISHNFLEETGTNFEDIKFPHHSFQEYFASMSLTLNNVKEFVSNPWWDETIKFFVGRINNETEFSEIIRKIFNSGNEYIWRGPFIAGICVANSKFRDSQVTKEIINKLITFTEDKYEYNHWKTLETLAKIKTDYVMIKLMEILHIDDEDVCWKAAELCCESKFKRTGIPSSLQAGKDEYVSGIDVFLSSDKVKSEIMIEPLLKDLESEYEYVRMIAVKTLGKIKSEKAIEPLIHAFINKDEKEYINMYIADALYSILEKLIEEYQFTDIQIIEKYDLQKLALPDSCPGGYQYGYELLVKLIENSHKRA